MREIWLRDWQVGGWTKMKKRWIVGKKSVLKCCCRPTPFTRKKFLFLPLFPGLRTPAGDIQAYLAVL